jgi:hypothetical protein
MNAIDFLIKEHNQVRKTLVDISNSSHHYETKRKMFKLLGENLIRHETMEHRVWYPHFKNDHRLNEQVKHLVKEETYAEDAIKHLLEIKTEAVWEDHFIKFKKDVEHHAEEEENELFPEVKKFLSANDLEKIGAEMDDFKKAYRQ